MCSLTGCRLGPPAAAATGLASPEPSREVIEGDWDDVDAAVRTATRRGQIAIEDRAEYRLVEGGEVSVVDYTLRTVRGDSGLLRVRRGDEGLEVTCRLGAVGAAEAEVTLVADIKERLRALRGQDYAPLAD